MRNLREKNIFKDENNIKHIRRNKTHDSQKLDEQGSEPDDNLKSEQNCY